MTATLLDAIGNTPLIQLHRVVPPGSARVVAKLELANPTGSMKDRVARAMIEAAEQDGRLKPGGTVVEYTGGTTGTSLAFLCAVKGYGLKIVFSDAFSEDKRLTMEAFGAQVTVLRSEHHQFTARVFQEMIATAQQLAQLPGHWLCDQLNNPDGAAGYHPLGDEIWRQTGGMVDAFVQGVGTAHSLHGTTEALWKHNPAVRIVAWEPAESAVLSGGPTGSHQIEGVGIGYPPPLWNPKLVSSIVQVPTEAAKAMSRRLAKEEGLFVGTSSGANVIAALRVAEELGPRSTVATLMVDSGMKYLSTDLFQKR